jgi:IS5 family transposase
MGLERMLRMYIVQQCFGQTKKGNQWHFGMKAHIGVDADCRGHGSLDSHRVGIS